MKDNGCGFLIIMVVLLVAKPELVFWWILFWLVLAILAKE